MWVIYHGYKATSAPLMAAILHRYFYPSIVGSDKKRSAANLWFQGMFWKTRLSPVETGSFWLLCWWVNTLWFWQLRKSGLCAGAKTFCYLKRTIHTAMELTGNWEQVMFVDTSGCTNLSLELGIWFRQLTCQVLGGSLAQTKTAIIRLGFVQEYVRWVKP